MVAKVEHDGPPNAMRTMIATRATKRGASILMAHFYLKTGACARGTSLGGVPNAGSELDSPAAWGIFQLESMVKA